MPRAGGKYVRGVRGAHRLVRYDSVGAVGRHLRTAALVRGNAYPSAFADSDRLNCYFVASSFGS